MMRSDFTLHAQFWQLGISVPPCESGSELTTASETKLEMVRMNLFIRCNLPLPLPFGYRS